LFGSATLSHVYANTGRSYTAYHQNTNRISTLADCNHDTPWQISTAVNFNDNASPVLTGIPILHPSYGQLFDYTIPSTSPNGQPVVFSITRAGLGNPGDGTSGMVTAFPAGLTLSAGGRILWTPDPAVNPGSCGKSSVSTTAPLFSFQVTANASVDNSVALDFIFQVGIASSVLPPTIAFSSAVPATAVINVAVGDTVTFDAIANQVFQSAYPNNHVMEVYSILPVGATLGACQEGTDAMGFSHTGTCTRTFSWTPLAIQSKNLIFTAENSQMLSSMPITVTINVVAPGNCGAGATVQNFQWSCSSEQTVSVTSNGNQAALSPQAGPCI